MSARPYTRSDYLAIKSATRRACDNAGPLHEIAKHTRADAALLSRYGNPNNSTFIAIDQAMDLDLLDGNYCILRALAEVCGFDLVRRDKGTATDTIESHIGAVGKESGELISQMCGAVADRKITPVEAAKIEKEAQDVSDKVRDLRDDMRRIRAGER